MKQAVWNGVVLAESDQTIIIEGNHYFPKNAVNWDYFEDSDMYSACHWKGEASYYNININGEVNKDAAWYYPDPKTRAQQIKNHVAFWRGVEIQDA